MEVKLLKAVYSNNKAYHKVASIVEPGVLSDIGQILFDAARHYYERDSKAESIDYELVEQDLEKNYPRHASSLTAALSNIKHLDVSVPNVLHSYVATKLESVGHQMTEAIASGNKEQLDELVEEYQKYSNGALEEDERRIYNKHSVHDIAASTSGHALIPVFPTSFAEQLDGGVVRGSHLLIFGRPDSGKTMVAITNVVGLLKEGYRVLYVGNEDPDDQMLMRLICALTGKSKIDVVKDPTKAEALAYQHGYENLIFAGLAPGTMGEIKHLIEEYSPDVVFIDQLRNLNMWEANKVLQLEKAAQQARTLGKQYGVTVFSITQAGDSAENKLVLDMGDVDFSNTGIPGQMDLMIGVGVDEVSRRHDQVMLSVCKNKINGNYFHTPVKINKVASIVEEG